MSATGKPVCDGGTCPFCGRAEDELKELRAEVERLGRLVESLAASVRNLDIRTIGSMMLG